MAQVERFSPSSPYRYPVPRLRRAGMLLSQCHVSRCTVSSQAQDQPVRLLIVALLAKNAVNYAAERSVSRIRTASGSSAGAAYDWGAGASETDSSAVL